LPLSLLTFTGASQFAAVGVVASGGAAASAIAAATMLGTRNALYGIQMAPLLNVKGARRVLAAHVTIDESTGVALSQAPRGVAAMREGFWITGLGSSSSGTSSRWSVRSAPRRSAIRRHGDSTRRSRRRFWFVVAALADEFPARRRGHLHGLRDARHAVVSGRTADHRDDGRRRRARMEGQVSSLAMWIVLGSTGVLCFSIKLLGHWSPNRGWRTLDSSGSTR